MKIYKSQYPEVVHRILSHPVIQQVTSGTTPVKDFKVDASFQHLLIENEAKQIIGCFQYRCTTSVLVEIHINILPEHWGSKCGLKATLKALKWLKNHTEFKKAWTDVPVVCIKILELMKEAGGVPCGIIKQGCVYNNELTDLILFERDINE